MARSQPLIGWLLRVPVALVFLASGLIKLAAPREFLFDVQAFGFLPYALAFAVSLVLPWLEIVAAVALLFGRYRRGAVLTLIGLTLAFIVWLMVAYARGIHIDCGCFGSWLTFPNYAVHLGFNGVLLLVLLALARRLSRPSR